MQLNISLHKTRVKRTEMHILVIHPAKRGERGERGERGGGGGEGHREDANTQLYHDDTHISMKKT